VPGVDCVKSTCPDHPDLEVHRIPGTPRVRITTAIRGVSHPVVFRVHNTGIDALERAVKERVFNVKRNGAFAAPLRPLSTKHFFSSLAAFTRGIRRHLPSTLPITRRQFVDTYRGRKRIVYERALESLDGKPLTAKDSNVKVFVKFEKFNYTLKPDAVPRVISPRDPRFNVCIGRYIRPIEERIFDAIGELYKSKTVMKGMNALQQGRLMHSKWSSFKDPIAVGLDAERFDQHVSHTALRYEHEIYKKCFWRRSDRESFGELLSRQLVNQCSGQVSDGWLKYVVEGGRMSGDMNTSLGNCVLMCAMIWSYSSSLSINVHLANNGDDCVVFMERSDLQRFIRPLRAWFGRMGFSMVVEEPVFDLEKVQFCQTQPVFIGPNSDDYIMVRDPRVAIAKDVCALHNLRLPQDVSGWLNAVGEGGLSLTGGLPVWQEFYSMYIRSAVGKKSKIETGWGWGIRKLAEGIHAKHVPVTSQTRFSFWLAFGITPDEQAALEKFYLEGLVLLHHRSDIPVDAMLPL
jgi:hypothetical protein